MKITSVSYGRTKSFRNEYGNIRISMNADLDEGETTDQVLKTLEIAVDTELAERIGAHESFEADRIQSQRARSELYEINSTIASRRRVLKQLFEVLDNHQVAVPDHERRLCEADEIPEDIHDDDWDDPNEGGHQAYEDSE